MPVIETSIDKAWGFSTYFFHTLIKQRPEIYCRNASPLPIYLQKRDALKEFASPTQILMRSHTLTGNSNDEKYVSQVPSDDCHILLFAATFHCSNWH
jgi:hypothetical protein